MTRDSKEIKSFIGEDTSVTVLYDLSPGESRTRDYPGLPPIVDIVSVFVGDDDVIEDLGGDCLERLEQQIWESREEARPKP